MLLIWNIDHHHPQNYLQISIRSNLNQSFLFQPTLLSQPLSCSPFLSSSSFLRLLPRRPPPLHPHLPYHGPLTLPLPQALHFPSQFLLSVVHLTTSYHRSVSSCLSCHQVFNHFNPGCLDFKLAEGLKGPPPALFLPPLNLSRKD
jgi:hypothetical protein